MKSSLDRLARTITDPGFIQSNPLDSENPSIQNHLARSTGEALSELKSIATELASRSSEDALLAQRIMKAQTTVRLVSHLYFERREQNRGERRKVKREF